MSSEFRRRRGQKMFRVYSPLASTAQLARVSDLARARWERRCINAVHAANRRSTSSCHTFTRGAADSTLGTIIAAGSAASCRHRGVQEKYWTSFNIARSRAITHRNSNYMVTSKVERRCINAVHAANRRSTYCTHVILLRAERLIPL